MIWFNKELIWRVCADATTQSRMHMSAKFPWETHQKWIQMACRQVNQYSMFFREYLLLKKTARSSP